ncbi:MAG: hypothetical protein FWC72_07415 [Oscillospiraceae bacterium]|nr:hypothetical protein [Oscillospiraceae bacterium]
MDGVYVPPTGKLISLSLRYPRLVECVGVCPVCPCRNDTIDLTGVEPTTVGFEGDDTLPAGIHRSISGDGLHCGYSVPAARRIEPGMVVIPYTQR